MRWSWIVLVLAVCAHGLGLSRARDSISVPLPTPVGERDSAGVCTQTPYSDDSVSERAEDAPIGTGGQGSGRSGGGAIPASNPQGGAGREGGSAQSELIRGGDSAGPTDLLKLKRDDLFERAFKKAPPPRMRELPVSLRLEEMDVEQVRILWDEGFQDFQFQSSRLSRMLDSVLSPANRSKVNGKDGHFSSDRLRLNKFQVELDESQLVLRLSLPPEMKSERLLPMKALPGSALLGREIEPAKFSAYLNSNWTQDWTYGERFFTNDSLRKFWESYNGPQRPRREHLRVDLDGAVRSFDWVLWGSGKVVEPNAQWGPGAFVRQDTRLIRDFVPFDTRLTIGDVSILHDGGNFSIPPVGGAFLDVGDALPGMDKREGTEMEFFLERPARVDLVVNGDVARTFQLASGPHRLTGLSGRPGDNNVELQVTYPDGVRQNIPYRFSQASEKILQSGTRLASLGGGVRRLGENSYGTGSGDIVLSGTYSQGLTPFLNGKAGLAAQQGLAVGGAGLFWVQDSQSTWQVGGTFSVDSSGRFGQSWSAQNTQQMQSTSISTLIGYYQSSFWNAFFARPTKQRVKYSLQASATTQVWKGFLGATASVQFNRSVDSSTSPIDYSFGANYSLTAWNGLSLTASGSCMIQSGDFNPAATLTMSYFFNSGKHSFYAMDQTFNQRRYVPPMLSRIVLNDTMRVGTDKIVTQYDSTAVTPGSFENEWKTIGNAGWSWSDGMGVVGGRSISVNGNYGFDQYGLRMGGQRTTNYADLSASYSLTDQSQLGLVTRSHYLTTRAETSLMFADGAFAVGRRVQDGFVLVRGRENLGGTTFRVNPSDQYNSEYSSGNRLLAASYGLFSSYRTGDVQVKAVELPAGVMLEGDRFSVRNTYKQGFLLELGKPPSVFLRMRLVDESNDPLSYVTFRVFASDDTAHSIYQSFCSKEGMVQIADLEAGKSYFLRFGEDSFIRDLKFEIPKGATAVLNLGDRRIEHQSFTQISKVSLLGTPGQADKSAPAAPASTAPAR